MEPNFCFKCKQYIWFTLDSDKIIFLNYETDIPAGFACIDNYKHKRVRP